MKAIDPGMKEELQALLDRHPQMEPTPMLDNGQLIILSIVDGIPKITRDPKPDYSSGLPDVGSGQSTPICRIYHLLKELAVPQEEDRLLSAAAMQIQAPATPAEGSVRIGPPTTPTIAEIVISTASGNSSLRPQEDTNGMYRHLERLHAQLRDTLAKNPDLPPLVIKTSKENIEVSVAGGGLTLARTSSPGQVYAQIWHTTQARLLQLARTIQGLEEKLYGSSASIKVAKAPAKLSASENLARALSEIDCGNIAVQIRSRKKTLYLSGAGKMITYRGIRTTLEDGKLLDERVAQEPSGYTQVEYGVLPKPLAAVLQAYWAYISRGSPNTNENKENG